MTALPEAPTTPKTGWPNWLKAVALVAAGLVAVGILGLVAGDEAGTETLSPGATEAVLGDTDPYAAYGLSETDGLAADLAWDVQSPTEQADLCDGLDTFGSDNPIIVQAFSDAAEVDYATGESILAYIDGEKC